MGNISIAEKNMVGLPVEGEEEEEEEEAEDEDEEEEEEEEGDEGGHTYNEAYIPAEKEPEPAETSEQEPVFEGYLPPPPDVQAEEIKQLRSQNQYLREYVSQLEKKIENMETENRLKAEIKLKKREKREEKKQKRQQRKLRDKEEEEEELLRAAAAAKKKKKKKKRKEEKKKENRRRELEEKEKENRRREEEELSLIHI